VSDNLLDQIDAGQQQSVAANLSAAVQAKADMAAQAEMYARKLGLPPQTVQRNLQPVQQRSNLLDAISATNDSPELKDWAAGDPQNAAVAHDQFPALAGISNLAKRTWADFAGGISGGVAGAVGGLGAAADAAGTMIGQPSTGASSARTGILAPLTDLARANQKAYASRVQSPNLADNLVNMVGNIFPALAAPEALPGYFAAQGADTAATQNAAAFRSGIAPMIAQASGVKTPPPSMSQTGTTAGAINVLGQATVQGVLGALPIAHYAEAVLPEIGNAALSALTKLGIGTGAAAVQGAAMQGGANLVAKATVDPNQDLTEGVGTSAGQMAILHALLRLPGAASELSNRAQSSQQQDAFQQTVDAVRESPMPERSPERFKSLMQSASQGGNVYVPAEKVTEYLQSQTPDKAAQFVDQTGIGAQLDAATVSGSKVVIPAEAYLAHVAPTDAHDAFANDLTLSQDGLSRNELEENAKADSPEGLQAMGDDIIKSAQADAKAMEPQQRVYADALKSLTDQGLGRPEASQVAALMSARYATRADRLNEATADTRSPAEPDPTDAWQEYHRAAGQGGLRFTVGEGDQPAAQSLSQPDEGNQPRGRIDLPDDGSAAIIRIFGARDKSTVPHELGHAFLEELRQDAMRPEAPQSLKDDYAETAKALGFEGLKDDEHIPVESHEQFARGFERYLMEGRAPSEGLRGVFVRFSNWLKRIYGNLRNLDAESTVAIKGVYDRLLATDEEIRRVETGQSLTPDFSSPEDAGMTKAEFAEYQRAVVAAQQSAREKIVSTAMKDIRRTRTKEWKEERAALRERISSEVDARPDVKAYHLLTRGELLGDDASDPRAAVLGESRKLNRADAADALGGDDRIGRLPRGSTVEKGGLHPDDVAEVTGFDTGQQMVGEVAALHEFVQAARDGGDKRPMREIVTDHETDQAMLAKHGDALDSQAIQAAALDSVHDDLREKMLQIEQRALERQAGEPAGPWTTDTLKAFAEGEVSKQKVSSLKPETYLRAERRAGIEAQRALLKGDKLAALAAKRRQITSFHLYRAALDAHQELGVLERMFARYAKRDAWKSISPPFFNQISNLLSRFGWREPNQNTADDFESFVAQQANEGVTVVAPPALQSPYYRTAYPDMSVDEARDLGATIKSLAHLGRDDQSALVLGKRVSLDALADEVAANVQKAQNLPKDDPAAVRERDMVANARSSLLRIEFMSDMMDMQDPNGPFNRAIVRGQSEANAKEIELSHDLLKKLNGVWEHVPWEERRTWLRNVDPGALTDPDSNGKPVKLTKANVIAMALNSGNAENWSKLAGGWGWDEAEAKSIIDRNLSENEWKFVQGIWDTIESLREPYFDAEERLTGVRPKTVEASPVQTPYGELKGGYYPIKYDPTRNRSVREKQDTMEAAFGRKLTGAATRNGSAQERTNFDAPIFLSPEAVIFGHSRDIVKRIAWGEQFLSAQRFLKNPVIEKAVKTRLGAEFHDSMIKLNRIAVGYSLIDEKSQAWAERLFRTIRTNSVINIAGINPRIILEHAGAHPQTIAVIGKEWWAKGLAKYASDPVGQAQFVFDRSPEMRARKFQANREIADLLSDLETHRDLVTNVAGRIGISSDVVRKVREASHVPVSWTNMRLVALPTWHGGYMKAVASGASEADAVAAGDKAVRIAHGGGAPKDMALVQQGNEFWKMLTTFYSYHNNQYNLYERSVDNIKQARNGKDFRRSLEGMFWALLGSSLIGAFVSGHAPTNLDPSEWGRWTADTSIRAIWEGIPLVRDVGNGLVDTVEGKNPDWFGSLPQKRALESVGLASRDLARMVQSATGDPDAKPPSPKWIQHLVEAPGYFLGLPMASPARSLQYAHDLSTGAQQPANKLEEAEGLLFGAPPKKH
jgi:hypothetical protein